MRTPLIPLTDKLKQAIPKSTIVTATARQANELHYSWAYDLVTCGKQAWKAPNIVPFNAWVLDLYEALTRMGHSTARYGLLQQSALDLAFRMCSPADEYSKHASAVVGAWSIYCGWNLHRVAPDLDITENGRLFHRWIRNFEEFCNEQEVVSIPLLPKLVADAIRAGSLVPQPICLFGCDELTPSQHDLVQQMGRIGQLGDSQSPSLLDRSTQKVHVFKSQAREKSGSVQWARERLSKLGPECRIGIVVPQLSSDYLTIRRHWEAAFHDQDDIDQLVNIGSGVPLGETRLCQDIIKLLSWTIGDFSYSEVLQLGRSPYLTALEIPTEFHRNYPDRFRFAGYASRSNSTASKQITRMITRRRSLLSDWADVALQVFRLAGWMADSDSDEDRRVHASIVNVLDDVSHLSAFVGLVPWQHAVELIRDGLRSAQLHYETRNSPIQVVDRKESIGLHFDSLWISNLSEDNWPPDSNPNPMIPISVQRRALVPRVTHQQMLTWAQRLTEMWADSASEVVFSAAPNEEQSETQPSRLLNNYENSDIAEILDQFDVAEFDHPWGAMEKQDLLREFISDHGTSLPINEVTRQRTSTLKDQSNCPFRAWAIHRAKLPDSEQPHRFPDPADRGAAVHKVLQVLLEQARDQQAILNLDEITIDMAIEDAVQPYKKLLLPVRFIEFEKARIRELIEEWRELEESRQPFDIIAVEKEYVLELEGFNLKMRVDRIDKTESLKALVIDYKTGKVRIGDWLSPRPLETQMPLYSLVVPDCDALAYQLVVKGGSRLSGISGESEANLSEKGIRPSTKQFDSKFHELTKDWHSALATIAREFKEGLATVKPTKPSTTCRNCHLDGFCRTFTDTDMPSVPELENE